ncbi:MAG: cobalamin-binding protein [Candidatus Diapherotrites archaeon]|nr:cobalamin-binding protein [Candidatus Diapherotrites archaeon]
MPVAKQIFRKIVSLAPSNTNLLFRFGLQSKIIGATEYDKHLFSQEFHPEIVTGWLNANFEKISMLKPDLILTSTFLQEALANKLLEKGFTVKHFDVNNLEGIRDSIFELGKLFSLTSKARALILEFDFGLQKISEKSKNLPRKRVYCEEWNSPPMVSGNWVPELLRIAGGIPMSSAGEPSRKFEFKELQNFDPEIIVLHWCGFGEKINVQEVLDRPGWNSLRAVREKKVFVINDAYLNSPDLGLLRGAEKLQEIIEGVGFD